MRPVRSTRSRLAVGRSASPSGTTRLRIKQRQKRYKPGTDLYMMQATVDLLSQQGERAESKLPTRRRLRIRRVFDETTGRGHRRLSLDRERIPPPTSLRPHPALMPLRLLGGTAYRRVHHEVDKAERENVGVEAAHQAERFGESAASLTGRLAQSAYRNHKLKPYRTADKLRLELRQAQSEMQIVQNARQYPPLRSSNPIARWQQKRRIRKRYAEALRTQERVVSTSDVLKRDAGKASNLALHFVKRHRMNLAVVAVLLLFGYQALSAVSTLSAMAGQMMTAVLAASYTAEDADLSEADMLYSHLEAELEQTMLTIPAAYPGYDEYRVSSAGIGHDPFALLAYLSARYEDFHFSAVEAELNDLFVAQYSLSIQPVTEIRYRTEYYSTIGPNGKIMGGSRQVPYDYTILYATLTAVELESLLLDRLDADQQERYALLIETLGARQFYTSPVPAPWKNHISSFYGYRQHPFEGELSLHRGLDLAYPSGTPISSIHDGTVVAAHSSDSGDFGLYVIIEDKHGVRSVYAHCSRILVAVGQSVEKGDIIADVGNSGLSTGPHLHIELIRDGLYLNPLFHLQGY